MNKFHLIKVHFGRWSERIDQNWLERRYRFFADYTLKSLQQQLLDGWTPRLWICCNTGDMRERVESLRKIVPPNTLFTFSERTDQGVQDEHFLKSAELTQKDRDEIENCEYVYVTRIDSDDLYAPDALQIAHDAEPKNAGNLEATVFSRGYSHDLISGRIGVHRNWPTPFFTVMYPRKIFLNPIKFLECNIGDHSKLGSACICHRLPDWKFCVLIHHNNYGSDFDYSREKDVPIERNWSLQRFLAQPVVFDVDDFCDAKNCLDELDVLKVRYPNFRCTLFTIPTATSQELLQRVRNRNEKNQWIELAVHGIQHQPNEELKVLTPDSLSHYLRTVDWNTYTKGFRPPGWYIEPGHVRACSEAGLWVALHERDKKLGEICSHGYYTCGARTPYWHGHTHNTCNNWLKQEMPILLNKWSKSQEFSFVSDAVLVPQK